MKHREIRFRRYDATTAELWPGRSFAIDPPGWPDAARSLAGCAAEVRVCPSVLEGLPTSAMLAASALRDAGIGLALTGAGRPDHLRWLRMLPWSAVIAHPALLRAGAPDRTRLIESWADAACRRGIGFVAPFSADPAFVAAVDDAPELPRLRKAGFTHAEVSTA